MAIPRLKSDGADSAKQMNRVFAENLQDMLRKVTTTGAISPPVFMLDNAAEENDLDS